MTGGTRVAAPDAGLQGKREKGSQSADKPSICDYSERDMGVGCSFYKGCRVEGHVCLSIGDRHLGLRGLLRRSGRLLGSARSIRCSAQGRGMFGKATASPGLSQAVRMGVRTPVARPQARRVTTLNKRGSLRSSKTIAATQVGMSHGCRLALVWKCQPRRRHHNSGFARSFLIVPPDIFARPPRRKNNSSRATGAVDAATGPA